MDKSESEATEDRQGRTDDPLAAGYSSPTYVSLNPPPWVFFFCFFLCFVREHKRRERRLRKMSPLGRSGGLL